MLTPSDQPDSWQPLVVEPGVIHVRSYQEIERLARHPDVAGVGRSFLEFCGVTEGPLWEWFGELMFTTEGATHMRLRRVVQRWFTTASVLRQRAFATEAVTQRLELLHTAGGGDLLASLLDVPTTVMCQTLGIPDSMVQEVIAISDAVSPAFGLISPEQIPAATAALKQLHDLTASILQRTDSSSGNAGLIHDLRQDLSERETIVMVGSLLFGGHDTTSSQIGWMLQTLLANLWVFDALNQGGISPADVVAETMRVAPSIGAIPRTLIADVAVCDQVFQPGTLVWLETSASAMQESVWGDPEVFRPARFAEPGCAKVQTFGAGAHYCLGVAMAKMVLEAVVEQLTPLADGLHAVESLSDVPVVAILANRPARVLVTWDAMAEA